MVEKFEYKGLWFLPGDPDNKVVGTLYFNPFGQTKLELIGGSFEGVENNNNKELDFFENKIEDLVLGTTTTGKKLTLTKCFRANILSQSYLPFDILEGEHFSKISDIKFYRVNAKISYLENWVNIWGFKIQLNIQSKEITTSFKLPDNIVFNIDDDLKGEFAFSYKPDLLPNADYKIEQHTRLQLIHKQEMDYEYFLKLLEHFRLFVALGVFSHVEIENLEFYSKSILNEYVNGENVETPVKLYRPKLPMNNKFQKVEPTSFLFTYKKIESNFESIIKKWFVLKDNISPVIGALFEIFSKRTIYTEFKFIHVVQALEVYHRLIKQNKEKLFLEFNKSFSPILAKLNEEEQEWLNEKVGHSYEPRLRKMLKELFSEFRIIPLSKIVTSNDDIKSLINKTVNSRNYYTHYDPALKDLACHGDDLRYLFEKLKVLLIVIILRETGFGLDEIEDLFRRNVWIYFNHIIKE